MNDAEGLQPDVAEDVLVESAGIHLDKTLMVFGDARKVVGQLVDALSPHRVAV